MATDLQTQQTKINGKLPLLVGSQARAGSSFSALLNLWSLRTLIKLMVERDFVGRYKGSMLGALWPILNPLGHMALYTFLFSVILRVKFGDGTSNFALYLMCAFLPWTAMSESVASSTTKVLEMPNLVKRVVFPLEILPLVTSISSFASSIIGLGILFLVAAVLQQTVHATVLLLPLVLIPHFLFTLGLSWILASLGVFIRDMKHIVGLGMSAWMYATPIVYPAEMIPDKLKWILTVNPVAGMIIDYRKIILEGTTPDLQGYTIYTSISIVLFFLGFHYFYKTKKSFADII